MRKHFNKICLITIFIMLFIIPTTAFADKYSTDSSWKWSNPSQVNWKLTNFTTNTSLSTWVNNGATAWNNAGTKISMFNSTYFTKGVQVNVGNYGNTGWDGSTTKDILAEKATILLNNSSTDAKNNGSELVSHEFGHTHGLNDVSYTDVLMRGSGYKGSATVTIHDKEGINSLYGAP